MVTGLRRSIANIPIQTSFNYHKRFKEISQKLDLFADELGIRDKISLAIGQFNSRPTALLAENSVQVPFWFLFRYQDVPAQFRLTNINDPRITDDRFLSQLAAWMNQKIVGAGLGAICRPADKEVLQTVLKLLRDPNKYEECKNFVLGHEMAHHAFKQELNEAFLAQDQCDIFGLGGLVLLIVMYVVAVSIIPLVNVSLTFSLIGITVMITSAVFLHAHLRPTIPAIADRLENEKQADLSAARALQNAEGGIYYFESHRLHNLALCNGFVERSIHYDILGNAIYDKDHPPLTTRIDYLRAYQSEQRNNGK